MRHVACKDAILLFLRDALFLVILFNIRHHERRVKCFGRSRSEYGSESRGLFVVWQVGIYMYVTDDSPVFPVILLEEFWSMNVLDWFP